MVVLDSSLQITLSFIENVVSFQTVYGFSSAPATVKHDCVLASDGFCFNNF